MLRNAPLLAIAMLVLSSCGGGNREINSRGTADKGNYQAGFAQGMCDFIKHLDRYQPGTVEGVFLFTEEERETPYARGWISGFEQAKAAVDKRFIPSRLKVDKIYSELLQKSVNNEVVTVDELYEIFYR